MDLGLRGQTITKPDFDRAMTLGTDAGHELSIESDCTLGTESGTWTASPDPATEEPDQISSLPNRTISTATVDQSGVLAIAFTDGDHLTVRPDPDFDAWTLAGPGSRKVVCLPGGDLATWQTDAS